MLRVFENRMLWLFQPDRDEVKREWRKLHNEKISYLNDLNSSPNIIWVIKLRRVRWAGHVERRGIGELRTGFWWGMMKKRDHLEDLGIDGWIIKVDLQEIG